MSDAPEEKEKEEEGEEEEEENEEGDSPLSVKKNYREIVGNRKVY